MKNTKPETTLGMKGERKAGRKKTTDMVDCTSQYP